MKASEFYQARLKEVQVDYIDHNNCTSDFNGYPYGSINDSMICAIEKTENNVTKSLNTIVSSRLSFIHCMIFDKLLDFDYLIKHQSFRLFLFSKCKKDAGGSLYDAENEVLVGIVSWGVTISSWGPPSIGVLHRFSLCFLSFQQSTLALQIR